MALQENTREYVARAYLLSGMAKASISPTHQAKSHLKKALEISTEVGFKELRHKTHLELGRLYNSLANVEGEKLLTLAENQLGQAKKTFEDIISHLEEPDLRQMFLNSHLAQTHPSREKLCVRKT